MRCLNCNTVVADDDPACPACGAHCTQTVAEQERLANFRPYLMLLMLFAGILGYAAAYVKLYGHVHDRADILEQKSNAYLCGLCTATIGFAADAYRHFGRRRRKAPSPRVSLSRSFADPS